MVMDWFPIFFMGFGLGFLVSYIIFSVILRK